MKILVATHSYGLNGAAAILKSTLEFWVKQLGWQVDALVTDELLKQHEAEFSRIGVRPIVKAGLGEGYQLALVNTAVNLGYLDLFYGKLPVVLWVHEGTTLIHNIKAPPAEIARALSKARLLIFQTPWQSEAVFKSFIHHLPKERIVSIPCGVEIEGTPPARSARTSNVTRIVSMGSVYPRKRQLDLAKAVVNLSRKLEIHCSFVGSLENVQAFGPQIKEYLENYPGTLDWMGGVDGGKKLSAIVNADIACFPSGDETFGISALETALLGLPVVLADLPVYQEVGWVHGKNCLKFPVGNVSALEGQLEALIHNRDLQLGLSKAGRDLASRYSMADFFNKMTAAVSAIR